MADKKIVTMAGKRQMEKQLADLQLYLRVDVAEKLKEAIAQGDLSENAEYDAARDEQAKTQAAIEALKDQLNNLEIVDTTDMAEDEINIGSTVTLFDIDEDEELELTIVGATEANSLENKISMESDMGKALLHKKAGETVSVKGFEYEIRAVAR